MKRVCHFSSVHKGLDTRIFHKECVSLANAGYDTHLVSNVSEAEVAEAARRGVTAHRLPIGPQAGRPSRMTVHAWRCYRMALALDADVYHFHDPELIPYGVLLARAGKRVVCDVHEDLVGEIYGKDWVPLQARRAVAAFARAAQDFGASRFSALVAATPYIGSLFEGVAKQVVVINNYPLLHELNLADDSDGKVEPRDKVCYVGGIHPIRGIREMVKATELSGAELLLAGDFPPGPLRDEVTQYAGWAKVREYGKVGRKAVADILARSFAGLVTLHPDPNYINSQPIKMFEYMSAGVPVIASDFPLWRSIIDGAKCGICVDQSSPEAIAAAIRHLRTHPEEVIRMGANGRRAVADKYRWDREEAKLLALYRSLLGEEEEGERELAARPLADVSKV